MLMSMRYRDEFELHIYPKYFELLVGGKRWSPRCINSYMAGMIECSQHPSNSPASKPAFLGAIP